MIKILLTSILLSTIVTAASANRIVANSSNYRSYLSSLAPGDTLVLSAGVYTNNLTLKNLNGTALQPIVIMGDQQLYTTVFQAQSCCNTVSITQCSYLVIKNLQLDGMNVPVDAVKGEGTAGNWAHHITLEYLNIIGYGNDQQIVGISTKCHAWDWVIRKNRIVGAGTGMYLGNSDGDKPFVNGLIEYNLVMNTIGYNIEIKHQLVGVRDAFPGTSVAGKTIIRHNVFCKDSNAATGANARPNLLVGAFPATGAGSTDYYEIYGNLFYQNPVEALLQATGSTALYNNVFVNHYNPSGIRAVYITAQNGFLPRDMRIFHNTVWVANASGGIRLYNPDPAYRQYCYANAVFAPQPVTNFSDTMGNITDSYANASQYVLSATQQLSSLDMYPQSGRLKGTVTPGMLFNTFTDWNLDFNGDTTDWSYRGAYSGCCVNKGWHLRLDTMPTVVRAPASVTQPRVADLGFTIRPNPARDRFVLEQSGCRKIEGVRIVDGIGREVFRGTPAGSATQQIVVETSGWSRGVYVIRFVADGRIFVRELIVY